MSEDLLKTFITVVVGGLIGLAGLWIGKQPQTDRRKPPSEEERRNDPLLLDIVNDQVRLLFGQYERRIKELEAAVARMEGQRDEREKRIEALEDENRDLRQTVDRQEGRIVDLKLQLDLMKGRETRRDG